jgi:hypothetical protein
MGPFPRCLRTRVIPLAALGLALVAAPAAARVQTFEVLIDTDASAVTGCTRTVAPGTFTGVERILLTTVDTATATAQVTNVQEQSCASPPSTFGPLAPVVLPPGVTLPWSVGIDNGVGGAGVHVIETLIPIADLGSPPPSTLRLAVVACDSDGGVCTDVLTTTQPAPAPPQDILFALGGIPVVAVPTLGAAGMLLLALLLGASAFVLLRRRRKPALVAALVALSAGALWAATATMDGATSDWAPTDQVATDASGDPTPDLRALFAQNDTQRVYFRVDSTLRFDTPPTAVDDDATVAEDAPATTLDVLANDTDPDTPPGPRSIASVTQPAGGTVVITNGGADLTYQPSPNVCNDGAPTDDFTYTLAPGGSTATVHVTVTCVDDPPTAVDDAAAVDQDSAATDIQVLFNDLDGDGGPMSVSTVGDPTNGTTTNQTTHVTYQPDAGYCNDGNPTDDFTYTLNGGSTATVRVTVYCSGQCSAQTGRPDGCPCTVDGECASQNCNAGFCGPPLRR